jgi:hypothetical protein
MTDQQPQENGERSERPSHPWPAPVVPGGAAVPPPPLGPAADGSVTLEEPRRRRGRVAVGVVSALAVGGAAVFAAGQLVGGDEGGAASPEAAVASLVTALNDEDVLGMLDVMLPGERESLGDPMRDMVDELRRLDLLSDRADLSAVAGFDVEFSDLTYDVAMVRDDIATVSVSGDGSVTTDAGEIPLGAFLLEQAFGGEQLSGTERGGGPFVDVPVTTVERGGRWYVSLWYSMAEAIRAEAGAPVPDPGDAVVPAGADSPDAAVRGLLDALADLDLQGALALMNPDEVGVLHTYAPLVLPDTDGILEEAGISVSVTSADLRVGDRDGDRATVYVGDIGMRATDGTTTLELADGCVTIDEGTGPTTECADDLGGLADLDELLSGDGGSGDPGESNDELAAALDELSSTMTATFDDLGSLGIATDRVDGRWYVSPMRTGSDAVLAVLRAVQPGELDAMVDAMERVASALAGEIDAIVGGALDGVPGSDTGSDGGSDGTPDGDPEDPTVDAMNECFAKQDIDEYVRCVQEGVANGVIDPEYAPADALFADCRWGVAADVYATDLDDAAFLAWVDEASACFERHVAAGDLAEWRVPFELSDPTCYEGINPYRSGVSPEDFTRINECLFDAS